MRLIIGFLLGLIVATASSLSANDFGTWYDNQGNGGTYWNGPLGTQWMDSQGNGGMINQWPSQSFGSKKPC